jgi:hypothetical protein
MRTRQSPPKFDGATVIQTSIAFKGKVEGGPVLTLGDEGFAVVRVKVSDVDHPSRADGAVERLHKLSVLSVAIVDDDGIPDGVEGWIAETTEAAALADDRREGKEPLPLDADE